MGMVGAAFAKELSSASFSADAANGKQTDASHHLSREPWLGLGPLHKAVEPGAQLPRRTALMAGCAAIALAAGSVTTPQPANAYECVQQMSPGVYSTVGADAGGSATNLACGWFTNAAGDGSSNNTAIGFIANAQGNVSYNFAGG